MVYMYMYLGSYILDENKPDPWCYSLPARLECVRSEFEPLSSQTKDYNIGMCCYSAKYTALRSKTKDSLARKSG